MSAKLLLEQVSKRYVTRRGVVSALEDISLEVAPGDFVCLVGPSGCGKSTLLDIMAGLTMSDGGRVLADGQPILGPGRQRMMMFQESALFPWLDVFGNVMFGLNLTPGLSRAERRERALGYLKLVNLEGFAHANIHELSGGMKQRTALARALAPGPDVLLMDEPFGALDAITCDQLNRDVQEIWQRTGQTIIFVTHNMREAVCLGNRVLLMSPRPGRIIEEFNVALPRPRDANAVEVASITVEIAAVLKASSNKERPL